MTQYEPTEKVPERIENLYTIGGEILMCKLEHYKEDINWLAFPDFKFIVWNEFIDNADENEMINVLAEEAAEEAAAYFDNNFVVPLDSLQKNWALNMVRWESSKKYMEKFDLEPME